MPFFFPDNDNRKTRVIELGTEAQNYLHQAGKDHTTFNALLGTVVAFDTRGNIIKRWDKNGARYIWKIEEDVSTNDIAFIGQAEQKIQMKWSELTNITFETGAKIPSNLVPSIPNDLKLTSLKDPNALDSAPKYPVLIIGNVSYWPFSYIDNRIGMAIVAFDNKGNLLKRWDKNGARYIWKIEENLSTKEISFIGQSKQQIIMNISDLDIT